MPESTPPGWDVKLLRLAGLKGGLAQHRLGWLEFAALSYLVLPLLVFFAGFIAPIIAVPACLTIVFALYRLRPYATRATVPGRRDILLAVAAAALFLLACGYAPGSGRSWDWLKHYAILNELAQQSWPPVREETQSFLRYYLGFYLVPGLAAKLLGPRQIELYVLVETWAGLALLLALLLQRCNPTRPVIFVAVFLLFGGLDLVGSLLVGKHFSLLGHQEWWAAFARYAYQGHATLFLWVPQHALPGLLGVALLLPGRQPTPQPMLALLGVAAMFWSPFAALGLAPFAAAVMWRTWRSTILDAGTILLAIAVGVPLLVFLTAGASGVPHGPNWPNDLESAGRLALFLLLEVALCVVAVRYCSPRALRWPGLVIASLLVLPLYRIGIYNDFTMRVSIPALGLLAIAVASALSEARGRRWIPLALVVLVGGVGSVLEIIGRNLDGHVPVHEVSLRRGFLADDPRFFAQYNAPYPHWLLRR
ncbi:MAG: hypothetical protein AB7P50_02515 [Alphaproteobacteria bacterium]